jgi:hypothetical protein
MEDEGAVVAERRRERPRSFGGVGRREVRERRRDEIEESVVRRRMRGGIGGSDLS